VDEDQPSELEPINILLVRLMAIDEMDQQEGDKANLEASRKIAQRTVGSCCAVLSMLAIFGAVAGVITAAGSGSLASVSGDASGSWKEECQELQQESIQRMWLLQELIPTSPITATDFQHWKVFLDTGHQVVMTDLNRKGDLKSGQSVIACSSTDRPASQSILNTLLWYDIFGIILGIHIYGSKSTMITEYDLKSNTTLSEVSKFADEYFQKYPNYDVGDTNCQKYADALIRNFCDTENLPPKQTVWNEVIITSVFRCTGLGIFCIVLLYLVDVFTRVLKKTEMKKHTMVYRMSNMTYGPGRERHQYHLLVGFRSASPAQVDILERRNSPERRKPAWQNLDESLTGPLDQVIARFNTLHVDASDSAFITEDIATTLRSLVHQNVQDLYLNLRKTAVKGEAFASQLKGVLPRGLENFELKIFDCPDCDTKKFAKNLLPALPPGIKNINLQGEFVGQDHDEGLKILQNKCANVRCVID